MSENIIGQRIATLRKRANENQDDLAKVLNCNRGSIANYEAGKRVPDIATLIKIANHYDTSVDYIAGNSDSVSKNAEIKAVCDYLGLEENSLDNIKLTGEISFSIDFPMEIINYGLNPTQKFISFYKEAMNVFLQSKCFTDIISICTYEKILEYYVNKVLDSDIQNIDDINDDEKGELIAASQFVNSKQPYRLHRLNLFDIQDSVVSFVKSLTNIEKVDKEVIFDRASKIFIALIKKKAGNSDNGEH